MNGMMGKKMDMDDDDKGMKGMKMMGKEDMSMMVEEHGSDLEPTDVDFSLDDFSELSEDEKGDSVIMLAKGYVTGKDEESVSVRFDRAYIHGKKPPLGSGERFKRLEDALRSKGAKNPAALSAWVGRKKYGKARFQKLAAGGMRGMSHGDME